MGSPVSIEFNGAVVTELAHRLGSAPDPWSDLYQTRCLRRAGETAPNIVTRKLSSDDITIVIPSGFATYRDADEQATHELQLGFLDRAADD